MEFADDGELKTLLNKLEAPKKPFVLFVLNDNETTQSGGTHWSLLVFSRPESLFSTSIHRVQRIKDALNCRNCQVKPIR